MRTILLASLLSLTVPAALAQKPEDKPAASAAASTAATAIPLVGTWDYVIAPDSPDPEYGTFSIQAEGDHLGGSIVTDTTSPIAPFVMTGDAAAFTFEHPGLGEITVRGTLAGDRFEGEMEAKAVDVLFPLIATRQAGATPGDH